MAVEEMVVLGVTGAGVAASAVLSGAPSMWPVPPLCVSIALSGLGCIATLRIIPAMSAMFIKSHLFGIDLNKVSTKRDKNGGLARDASGSVVGVKIPESMGLISGTVFMLCLFAFIPFAFTEHMGGASGTGPASGFPHKDLIQYVAASLSISSMCFLGFADDVLDLRWRHKLLLPFAATLPILMVYYVNVGVTSVMVPIPLRALLGTSLLNLGILYYVYMLVITIFCTNAINILAGVNGLECGQTVVIALSVLVNNILQLTRLAPDVPGRENHLFSLYLILPFLGTNIALLWHNWYPSRVFVGDTFCYYAGMTFAVCGIVGENPKTIMLFFIPQWINFIYSLPQLFKFLGIPCPRHRMPAFDGETNCVKMSFTQFDPTKLNSMGRAVYGICRVLKLAYIEAQDDGTVKMSNMTIINFTLYLFGPMREDKLTMTLLAFQVLCSAFGFYIRYHLAALFYDVVH